MDEDRLSTLEFHLQLLLDMVDTNQYPFYQLIIKNGVSKYEMNSLITFCEELNKKYEEQREEGFVDFTLLLVQYVGMLPSVLNPKESLIALKKQSYFPELMSTLLTALDKIDE